MAIFTKHSSVFLPFSPGIPSVPVEMDHMRYICMDNCQIKKQRLGPKSKALFSKSRGIKRLALHDGGSIHGDHQFLVGGDGPNTGAVFGDPFFSCSGEVNPPCANCRKRQFQVIPTG